MSEVIIAKATLARADELAHLTLRRDTDKQLTLEEVVERSVEDGRHGIVYLRWIGSDEAAGQDAFARLRAERMAAGFVAR